MTAADVRLDVGGADALEPIDSRPSTFLRTILGTIEGRLGIALGVAMLALIIFGPLFAPYSPTELGVGPPSAGPSAEHLLGTDNLGRDVLSRFLTGGRTVLVVPFIAVSLALLFGGALGMLGGYKRGTVDVAITRTLDLLMALPPLLLVLVLIAGLGTSTTVLAVTVALVFVPRVGRVVRGATQAVVTSDYVAAAQARGERTSAILTREVLPNAAAPIIADYSLRMTYGIIFVATLSFLGFGAQPPSSDWGRMVAESRAFLSVSPWATLAPALAIAAIAIAFTLVGDAFTRHLTREADRGEVPL